MENKVINGIIHCVNYVCNGCPYERIYHQASAKMVSSSAGYVRCMQKLIEDIYENIKKENNYGDS